jgi:hypothetical protein
VPVLTAHLARLQVGDDHDQSVLQLLNRVVLHQACHLQKSWSVSIPVWRGNVEDVGTSCLVSSPSATWHT